MTENNEQVQMDAVEEFELRKKKMLNELMDSPLKAWRPSEKADGKSKGKVETIQVRDVITDKDVWFSRDKPRPIINEEGLNKLVKETGASFPRITYIEKQSDFASVEKGQVTVEATVYFPGAETTDQQQHVELGVANAMNCKDPISKSIIPIMAVKRAKARAFFRSPYINLSVYDETEMSDQLSKEFKQATDKVKSLEAELREKDLEIAKMQRQVKNVTQKTTDFFDLVKEHTLVKGVSIWKMNELPKIRNFVEKNKSTLSPLEERLFTLRMTELEREEKKKAAQQAEESSKEQTPPDQENNENEQPQDTSSTQ